MAAWGLEKSLRGAWGCIRAPLLHCLEPRRGYPSPPANGSSSPKANPAHSRNLLPAKASGRTGLLSLMLMKTTRKTGCRRQGAGEPEGNQERAGRLLEGGALGCTAVYVSQGPDHALRARTWPGCGCPMHPCPLPALKSTQVTGGCLALDWCQGER